MRPLVFISAVAARHGDNRTRYGNQGEIVLAVVLTEETGEVARAILGHLKNGPTPETRTRVVEECVDAAAVLMALADEIGEGGDL